VIKEALRAHWQALNMNEHLRPTAWEVYSKLKIPPGSGPRRDRARNVEKLVNEKLLGKRRGSTL